MCCYNMAAHIEEQLDSLVSQTRRPDELVVCDDLSSDRTVDIVRAFAGRAPFPVRIVQNERRLGCNKNFEKSIALCTGDIIFLCDHDDVWRAHKIEALLSVMQDETIGAAFGNAEVVTDVLKPMGWTLWDTCNFNPERRRRFAAGDQFPELLINNVMQGAAAAFRASFRSAILPIPLEWQHDYWIALIVSVHARIGFTEQCLLDYRQHGGNLIGAGLPYHPRPQRRPWEWPRRIGRWIEKARSPSAYYGRRLQALYDRQRPLRVLQDRLQRLGRAAPLAMIEPEIERWAREIVLVEGKMRRWAGEKALQQLSRPVDRAG